MFSTNYIQDYLREMGIEKTDGFLKEIDETDEESYKGLENIERAIDLLHWGFENNKRFFLQVDSDVDGYTSSAIFYAFFKKLYPNSFIEYRVHEGKEHGVILDTIPIHSDIIVIPDAGSSQLEVQEELDRQGRHVVILDHHEVDHNETFENVVLVNNQTSPNFKNKASSGAGVVYKTIQAYSEKYLEGANQNMYRDYTDLAAVGIISDMMDIRNLDNNFIIRKGLKNIKNPMLIALLERQSYSIKDPFHPTKIDIAFYIAPIVNGVIRFGTDEEKDQMFQGFAEYMKDEMVKTIYHGTSRTEHFYDHVARVSYNAKERQNRSKMKALEYLENRIEKGKLHENQLIIVEVSKDDVPQSITGLVAMEVMKKYNKPALIVRPREIEGEDELWGSGRGKPNGDFVSLRNFLRDSGLCTFAEGHDFAHGIGFKRKNLKALTQYANEKLAHIDFSVSETEVDFVFDTPALDFNMIKEFGEGMNLYGHMIPQPKFAVDLTLPKTSINFIGKAENIIKIFQNGVELIRFFAKDLVSHLKEMDGEYVTVTGVGRAQLNEWMGKVTPQITLDELSITESDFKLESLF